MNSMFSVMALARWHMAMPSPVATTGLEVVE